MVCSSVENSKVITTCDAKKHATLHDHLWWHIYSIITRIRRGKCIKQEKVIKFYEIIR